MNPATPVEPYADLLPELDMLLLMTIEPGFGGQQFMDFVLPKIRRARGLVAASGGEIWIQVDGGVTEDTIGRCAEAGRGHVRGRVGGVRLRRPGGPGEGTARRRLRPGARYRLGAPGPSGPRASLATRSGAACRVPIRSRATRSAGAVSGEPAW